MTGLRTLPLAFATLFLLTGTAFAVTVTNKDSKGHKIGIDWGNKEAVHTVIAGKSYKFECPEGCGVTGPWGFSWMAKGNDDIVTNGKSLVTVGELPSG